MNSDKAIIEIISLENRPAIATCVTDKMLEIIDSQSQKKQKTLIFYNRRGTSGTYICQDCGFFEKCPNCDIAFSYHSFPKKILLCHQCNSKNILPNFCPNCKGTNFRDIGVGIEKIAKAIEQEKPDLKVGIIDSDHISKSIEIFEIIQNSDVIISTGLGSLITDTQIGAVVFALFEVNFSVPNYLIEEELYDHIAYIKKQNKPLYIQTFTPDYPMLQQAVFGNFKNFLDFLKKERKNFNYPPYSDFAILRIYNREKTALHNMILGFIEKINSLPEELAKDVFISYDRDIFEKYHGDFMQKIILKGKGVHDILEELSSVIVKSRNVFVDWK